MHQNFRPHSSVDPGEGSVRPHLLGGNTKTQQDSCSARICSFTLLQCLTSSIALAHHGHCNRHPSSSSHCTSVGARARLRGTISIISQRPTHAYMNDQTD